MEAYHFSSPDVKGPSLCLLEHLGGDLCPQAARAVQGPDIQVGVNSLKEGQRSVVWGARAHAVGPGCAPPRRGGLGGVEVAEPTGAWVQAQLGSPGTLPHWPILVLNPDWRHPCPFSLLPALAQRTRTPAGATAHVEGLLQQLHDVGRVLLQHAQRGHGEVRVQLLQERMPGPGLSLDKYHLVECRQQLRVIPTLQMGRLRPQTCWCIPESALLAPTCLGWGMGT